ncbi:MAG: Nif3-like dinuclear metal center hexameric protein [Isosphaeraceae bacterium]
MTTVRDVSRWLDGFAPPRLAESWDNVGLLWGDPDAEVRRIMTCLTVTPCTANEAVQERADLIVSHHPVLFRAVKRVVAGQAGNSFLWGLARANVSILSPHTAFDNTVGGINDGLATRLGLTEVGPLRPTPGAASFKVTVFTPEGDVEAVRSAAFQSGAGRIGAYEECSFAIPGVGTFRGGEGSNPTVGQAFRRESVSELRIEFVCPAERLAAVLSAVKSAHSYEEPAIDVFPLHIPAGLPGVGRVGLLPHPMALAEFARHVAQVLGQESTQYAGDPGLRIERVAIVCGAGDDFVSEAARIGAQVLLTGEARYHQAQEAESLGIGLVLAGHHGTERPGVEDLATRIAGAFPQAQVWPSRSEADPLRPAIVR